MKCVNHKAVVIIGMLLVSPMAMSDSCGAVLCMAESGSVDSECKTYRAPFFKIQVWKWVTRTNGKGESRQVRVLDVPGTISSRRSYLLDCDGGQSLVGGIIGRYKAILNDPGH